MKLVTFVLLVLLTGCATFTEPYTPSPPSEELRNSWGYRTLVADWPLELEKGFNGNTNCLAHARKAKEQLGKGVIVAGYAPRLGTCHAVLVVDGWAIDNGAISTRIFPACELDRHFGKPDPGMAACATSADVVFDPSAWCGTKS